MSLCIRGGSYAAITFLPTYSILWLIEKKYLFNNSNNTIIMSNRILPLIIFFISITCITIITYYKNDFKALIYILLLIPLALVITVIIGKRNDLVFGEKPLVTIFVTMTLCILFFINIFNIYPKYYNDKELIEVCNWIKVNTKNKDVFLTEPFTKVTGPVRLTCQRNVFVTF